MTENLYPKEARDYSYRRWMVRYSGLYLCETSRSWTSYYRTRKGARLAAWWFWLWSYNDRGSINLYDTWEYRND